VDRGKGGMGKARGREKLGPDKHGTGQRRRPAGSTSTSAST